MLQHYLTRLVLHYARKYISNIQADLNLSLWGGDVVLHDLELRLDVLQKELKIPKGFELVRGVIRELRIHIPWMALQSQPVEITLKCVECVVLTRQTSESIPEVATPGPQTPHTPEIPETPVLGSDPEDVKDEKEESQGRGGEGGWARALLTKVLANLTVNIEELKVISLSQLASGEAKKAPSRRDNETVASLELYLDKLTIASANTSWKTSCGDLYGPWRRVLKTVKLQGLALRLTRASRSHAIPRRTSGRSDKEEKLSQKRPKNGYILPKVDVMARARMYLGGPSADTLTAAEACATASSDGFPASECGAKVALEVRVGDTLAIHISPDQAFLLTRICTLYISIFKNKKKPLDSRRTSRTSTLLPLPLPLPASKRPSPGGPSQGLGVRSGSGSRSGDVGAGREGAEFGEESEATSDDHVAPERSESGWMASAWSLIMDEDTEGDTIEHEQLLKLMDRVRMVAPIPRLAVRFTMPKLVVQLLIPHEGSTETTSRPMSPPELRDLTPIRGTSSSRSTPLQTPISELFTFSSLQQTPTQSAQIEGRPVVPRSASQTANANPPFLTLQITDCFLTLSASLAPKKHLKSHQKSSPSPSSPPPQTPSSIPPQTAPLNLRITVKSVTARDLSRENSFFFALAPSLPLQWLDAAAGKKFQTTERDAPWKKEEGLVGPTVPMFFEQLRGGEEGGCGLEVVTQGGKAEVNLATVTLAATVSSSGSPSLFLSRLLPFIPPQSHIPSPPPQTPPLQPPPSPVSLNPVRKNTQHGGQKRVNINRVCIAVRVDDSWTLDGFRDPDRLNTTAFSLQHLQFGLKSGPPSVHASLNSANLALLSLQPEHMVPAVSTDSKGDEWKSCEILRFSSTFLKLHMPIPKPSLESLVSAPSTAIKANISQVKLHLSIDAYRVLILTASGVFAVVEEVRNRSQASLPQGREKAARSDPGMGTRRFLLELRPKDSTTPPRLRTASITLALAGLTASCIGTGGPQAVASLGSLKVSVTRKNATRDITVAPTLEAGSSGEYTPLISASISASAKAVKWASRLLRRGSRRRAGGPALAMPPKGSIHVSLSTGRSRLVWDTIWTEVLAFTLSTVRHASRFQASSSSPPKFAPSTEDYIDPVLASELLSPHEMPLGSERSFLGSELAALAPNGEQSGNNIIGLVDIVRINLRVRQVCLEIPTYDPFHCPMTSKGSALGLGVEGVVVGLPSVEVKVLSHDSITLRVHGFRVTTRQNPNTSFKENKTVDSEIVSPWEVRLQASLHRAERSQSYARGLNEAADSKFRTSSSALSPLLGVASTLSIVEASGEAAPLSISLSHGQASALAAALVFLRIPPTTLPTHHPPSLLPSRKQSQSKESRRGRESPRGGDRKEGGLALGVPSLLWRVDVRLRKVQLRVFLGGGECVAYRLQGVSSRAELEWGAGGPWMRGVRKLGNILFGMAMKGEGLGWTRFQLAVAESHLTYERPKSKLKRSLLTSRQVFLNFFKNRLPAATRNSRDNIAQFCLNLPQISEDLKNPPSSVLHAQCYIEPIEVSIDTKVLAKFLSVLSLLKTNSTRPEFPTTPSESPRFSNPQHVSTSGLRGFLAQGWRPEDKGGQRVGSECPFMAICLDVGAITLNLLSPCSRHALRLQFDRLWAHSTPINPPSGSRHSSDHRHKAHAALSGAIRYFVARNQASKYYPYRCQNCAAHRKTENKLEASPPKITHPEGSERMSVEAGLHGLCLSIGERIPNSSTYRWEGLSKPLKLFASLTLHAHATLHSNHKKLSRETETPVTPVTRRTATPVVEQNVRDTTPPPPPPTPGKPKPIIIPKRRRPRIQIFPGKHSTPGEKSWISEASGSGDRTSGTLATGLVARLHASATLKSPCLELTLSHSSLKQIHKCMSALALPQKKAMKNPHGVSSTGNFEKFSPEKSRSPDIRGVALSRVSTWMFLGDFEGLRVSISLPKQEGGGAAVALSGLRAEVSREVLGLEVGESERGVLKRYRRLGRWQSSLPFTQRESVRLELNVGGASAVQGDSKLIRWRMREKTRRGGRNTVVEDILSIVSTSVKLRDGRNIGFSPPDHGELVVNVRGMDIRLPVEVLETLMRNIRVTTDQDKAGRQANKHAKDSRIDEPKNDLHVLRSRPIWKPAFARTKLLLAAGSVTLTSGCPKPWSIPRRSPSPLPQDQHGTQPTTGVAFAMISWRDVFFARMPTTTKRRMLSDLLTDTMEARALGLSLRLGLAAGASGRPQVDEALAPTLIRLELHRRAVVEREEGMGMMPSMLTPISTPPTLLTPTEPADSERIIRVSGGSMKFDVKPLHVAICARLVQGILSAFPRRRKRNPPAPRLDDSKRPRLNSAKGRRGYSQDDLRAMRPDGERKSVRIPVGISTDAREAQPSSPPFPRHIRFGSAEEILDSKNKISKKIAWMEWTYAASRVVSTIITGAMLSAVPFQVSPDATQGAVLEYSLFAYDSFDEGYVRVGRFATRLDQPGRVILEHATYSKSWTLVWHLPITGVGRPRWTRWLASQPPEQLGQLVRVDSHAPMATTIGVTTRACLEASIDNLTFALRDTHLDSPPNTDKKSPVQIREKTQKSTEILEPELLTLHASNLSFKMCRWPRAGGDAGGWGGGTLMRIGGGAVWLDVIEHGSLARLPVVLPASVTVEVHSLPPEVFSDPSWHLDVALYKHRKLARKGVKIQGGTIRINVQEVPLLIARRLITVAKSLKSLIRAPPSTPDSLSPPLTSGEGTPEGVTRGQSEGITVRASSAGEKAHFLSRYVVENELGVPLDVTKSDLEEVWVAVGAGRRCSCRWMDDGEVRYIRLRVRNKAAGNSTGPWSQRVLVANPSTADIRAGVPSPVSWSRISLIDPSGARTVALIETTREPGLPSVRIRVVPTHIMRNNLAYPLKAELRSTRRDPVRFRLDPGSSRGVTLWEGGLGAARGESKSHEIWLRPFDDGGQLEWKEQGKWVKGCQLKAPKLRFGKKTWYGSQNHHLLFDALPLRYASVVAFEGKTGPVLVNVGPVASFRNRIGVPVEVGVREKGGGGRKGGRRRKLDVGETWDFEGINAVGEVEISVRFSTGDNILIASHDSTHTETCTWFPYGVESKGGVVDVASGAPLDFIPGTNPSTGHPILTLNPKLTIQNLTGQPIWIRALPPPNSRVVASEISLPHRFSKEGGLRKWPIFAPEGSMVVVGVEYAGRMHWSEPLKPQERRQSTPNSKKNPPTPPALLCTITARQPPPPSLPPSPNPLNLNPGSTFDEKVLLAPGGNRMKPNSTRAREKLVFFKFWVDVDNHVGAGELKEEEGEGGQDLAILPFCMVHNRTDMRLEVSEAIPDSEDGDESCLDGIWCARSKEDVVGVSKFKYPESESSVHVRVRPGGAAGGFEWSRIIRVEANKEGLREAVGIKCGNGGKRLFGIQLLRHQRVPHVIISRDANPPLVLFNNITRPISLRVSRPDPLSIASHPVPPGTYSELDLPRALPSSSTDPRLSESNANLTEKRKKSSPTAPEVKLDSGSISYIQFSLDGMRWSDTLDIRDRLTSWPTHTRLDESHLVKTEKEVQVARVPSGSGSTLEVAVRCIHKGATCFLAVESPSPLPETPNTPSTSRKAVSSPASFHLSVAMDQISVVLLDRMSQAPTPDEMSPLLSADAYKSRGVAKTLRALEGLGSDGEKLWWMRRNMWQYPPIVDVSLSKATLTLSHEPLSYSVRSLPESRLSSLRIKVERVQVDSHAKNCEFNVVLYAGDSRKRSSRNLSSNNPSHAEPAIKAAMDWIPAPKGFKQDGPMRVCFVERIAVALGPLTVNLEDSLVLRLLLLARDLSSVFRTETKVQTHFDPNLALAKRIGSSVQFVKLLDTVAGSRVTCRRITLEAVEATLQVHAAQVLRYLHIGAGRMPLSLSRVSIFAVRGQPGQVARQILAQYLADAILSAPIILGSLQIFGNPTFLVQSLITGLADFLTLPTHALARGPSAFLSALVDGTVSLVRHASEGTLTSLASFSSALARNLNRLSGDHGSTPRAGLTLRKGREYEGLGSPPAGRRGSVKPGQGQGLLTGVGCLAAGVWGGVTGVVTAPVRGALEGGAWGFMQGVGVGIVGAVTRPISGGLDLVAHTSQGLADISSDPPVAQRPLITTTGDASPLTSSKNVTFADPVESAEWRYAWGSISTLALHAAARTSLRVPGGEIEGWIVGLQLLRFPQAALQLLPTDFKAIGGEIQGTRTSRRITVVRIQRSLSFAASDIGDAGLVALGSSGVVVVGSDGHAVPGCRFFWNTCRLIAFRVRAETGSRPIYIVTFIPGDLGSNTNTNVNTQDVKKNQGTSTSEGGSTLSAGIICSEGEFRTFARLANLSQRFRLSII